MLPHERTVFPLIEKCARFLTGPRCREVLHSVFDNLHHLGDLAYGQDDLGRQPLVPAHRRIVAEQNAVQAERAAEAGEHVVPRGLQSSGQQLGDDPRTVAVHDERRQPIAFGVYHTPRACIDSLPTTRGSRDAVRPPLRIDRLPPARQQAQADL